jgi:hypothetical protein
MDWGNGNPEDIECVRMDGGYGMDVELVDMEGTGKILTK